MKCARCKEDKQHHGKGMCKSCHRRSLEKRPAAKPEVHPIVAQEAREQVSRERRQIQLLMNELREARSRQQFLDAMTSIRETPKIIAREKKSGIREMTAVVLASDWHVEEPVTPESVAFRNEYNLNIAINRIKRFFQSIIWNIEHHRASGRMKITDMVLALMGDLITGYIHEELVETSQLSPTETCRWLVPRIREGIYTLLEVLQLEHIEIPCSFGNHGRTTFKSRVSTGYANNFEWLMYHTLADSFRDESRVHFEVTNSAHQYVQVYDRVLHFHHGDSLRYQGGVGGLGIPLLKAVPQWDSVRFADYHHIGHFHQLVDYGRIMCNGSLIGFGPYSQHIRAPFEEPAQAMYFVDSKRGKCLVTKLWVGE